MGSKPKASKKKKGERNDQRKNGKARKKRACCGKGHGLDRCK